MGAPPLLRLLLLDSVCRRFSPDCLVEDCNSLPDQEVNQFPQERTVERFQEKG